MADKKDAMLHIRVSQKTLEKIREHAEKSGITQSEFCLNAILAATGEELGEDALRNMISRIAYIEESLKFFQQHRGDIETIKNLSERFDKFFEDIPEGKPSTSTSQAA